MNKKYMDFVPAKPVSKEPERPVRKTVVVTEVEEVAVEAIFEERKRPAGVSSGLKAPKLGVIEDFQPKFVQTDVKKRPLGAAKAGATEKNGFSTRVGAAMKAPLATKIGASVNNGVAKAKAQKVKMPVRDSAKIDKIFETALKQATTDDANEKGTVKVPKSAKSPFVNTEKVVKRPLSKNVYQKKIVVPKEEPSGPVTIISKPEKDSKVGMIVAIILTIILGATAGTVAFLLLPK